MQQLSAMQFVNLNGEVVVDVLSNIHMPNFLLQGQLISTSWLGPGTALARRGPLEILFILEIASLVYDSDCADKCMTINGEEGKEYFGNLPCKILFLSKKHQILLRIRFSRDINYPPTLGRNCFI